MAFLSSRPGTLTTMLRFKEVAALKNPSGDGWRAALEQTAALAGTQLAAHGWATLARPPLGLGDTSQRILPARKLNVSMTVFPTCLGQDTSTIYNPLLGRISIPENGSIDYVIHFKERKTCSGNPFSGPTRYRSGLWCP